MTKKDKISAKIEVLNTLGIEYRKTGNLDKAIRSFKDSLKRGPEVVETWLNLGYCYEDKKDFNKAINAYEKVLEINPNLDHVWFNLGICYGKKGDTDKKIECIKKAINLNPSEEKYREALGEVLIDAPSFTFDIFGRQFQEALETEEKNPEKWGFLAIMLEQRGDLDKALQACEKWIQLDPDNKLAQSRYWRILAILKSKEGDWSGVYDATQKALDLDKSDYYLWYLYGFACFYNQKPEDAKEAIRKCIELKPDDGDAWYFLALIHASKIEVEKSAECLEKAIQINPEYKAKFEQDKNFDTIRFFKAFQSLSK
jgi:tetratricopeptide (TPR) repeat protein